MSEAKLRFAEMHAEKTDDHGRLARDVLHFAAERDTLSDRIEELEAALRTYKGLAWVAELPEEYHAFTDRVNALVPDVG